MSDPSQVRAIPESDWRWRGMPGHLVVSDSCCFHMVTDVGEHRVSTIGCYHPKGQPKDYDHRETIGAGRLYETMVFALPRDSDEIDDWSELDSDGYNDEADAEAGHRAMCRRWAVLDA